jgi:hypothetical protein
MLQLGLILFGVVTLGVFWGMDLTLQVKALEARISVLEQSSDVAAKKQRCVPSAEGMLCDPPLMEGEAISCSPELSQCVVVESPVN